MNAAIDHALAPAARAALALVLPPSHRVTIPEPCALACVEGVRLARKMECPWAVGIMDRIFERAKVIDRGNDAMARRGW